MGYLIPVTPQAFVNRISIFGPDETNIKEISYQLSLHLTIPINIFTPPKSLELYIVADIIWGRVGDGWRHNRTFTPISRLIHVKRCSGEGGRGLGSWLGIFRRVHGT